MTKLLAGLVGAAAAWLRVYPLVQINQIENEVEKLEDEIFSVSNHGGDADQLRIPALQQRKHRRLEQIRALRSAIGNAD